MFSIVAWLLFATPRACAMLRSFLFSLFLSDSFSISFFFYLPFFSTGFFFLRRRLGLFVRKNIALPLDPALTFFSVFFFFISRRCRSILAVRLLWLVTVLLILSLDRPILPVIYCRWAVCHASKNERFLSHSSSCFPSHFFLLRISSFYTARARVWTCMCDYVCT